MFIVDWKERLTDYRTVYSRLGHLKKKPRNSREYYIKTKADIIFFQGTKFCGLYKETFS